MATTPIDISERGLAIAELLEELGRQIRELVDAVDPATARRRLDPSAWTKIGELSNQSFRWPTSSLDFYESFPVFEKDGQTLGIGYANRATYETRTRGVPYAVIFEVSAMSNYDPIAIFTATRDHDETGDMVAVIKGKGDRGKQMFGPGDELPPAYRDFDVDLYSNRVRGPRAYEKFAVVARGGDPHVMLDHALIQKRLRNR